MDSNQQNKSSDESDKPLSLQNLPPLDGSVIDTQNPNRTQSEQHQFSPIVYIAPGRPENTPDKCCCCQTRSCLRFFIIVMLNLTVYN